MMGTGPKHEIRGELAAALGEHLKLQVCKSAAGFYVGTMSDEGLPVSRESAEYWRQKVQAEEALARGKWTQRRES